MVVRPLPSHEPRRLSDYSQPPLLTQIPAMLELLVAEETEVLFSAFSNPNPTPEHQCRPLCRHLLHGWPLLPLSRLCPSCPSPLVRESASHICARSTATGCGGGGIFSILWIALQFLVFELSEIFTAVGLIEFIYKQSLANFFTTARSHFFTTPTASLCKVTRSAGS